MLIATVAAVLAALSIVQALAATFDYLAIGAYAEREAHEKTSRDARLAAELAVRLFPWSAPYWLRRALFLGEETCLAKSLACDLQIESLSRSTHLRPYWALPWALLVSAHTQQGSALEMTHALGRALALGPHDEPVRRSVLVGGLRFWEQLREGDKRLIAGMISTTIKNDLPLLAEAASDTGCIDIIRPFLMDAGALQQFEDALAKHRAKQVAN